MMEANLEGDLDDCLWLAGRGGGKFQGDQVLAPDGEHFVSSPFIVPEVTESYRRLQKL